MRNYRWMTGLMLVGVLASACSGPKDPFTYAFGKIDDDESARRRQAATPVISGAVPDAAAAGEAVVLTGEHFGKAQGASTLMIGDVEVAVDTWSDTTIEFTVAKDLPGGLQPAVVTVGAKASEPYKVGIRPTLKSISPAAGSGGKLVTLRGTNFGAKQGKGIVKAGGVTMQPKSWKRDAVTFTIPDTLDAGRRDITLDIGGVASNAQHFTVQPVVASAAPSRGVPESAFTIAGTNFGGAQAGGKVLFDGVEMSVARWSATAIDVTVPFAATAGAKSFTVTAGNQTSNPGSYTVAAPSLGGASPGYAFAGATVVLTGADFGSAQRGSRLLLDGAPLTPLAWSNGQVTFVVPASVDAGAHTLAVRVGTLTSAAQPFVVRPTVTRVRPQAGPAGTLVTVDGYGFGVTGVVRLGADALVPLVWTNTAVVFAVAATAPAAAVVTIESGGQLSNGVVFTVTAPGAPVIQSLTPAAGLAGATVLVAGQNLGLATGQVSIGGTLVAPTAWADTLVSFTVPALATGTKPVFLLVGGNPTNALPFAVSTATSPWITSLSPASGNAGTVLTISGIRFGATKGASTVTVGGVVAATSLWSATQIRATVPAAAAAGILDVVVTVNAEDSNSATFVLTPALTAVAPVAAAVGDSVTLTGTSFGAAQDASLVYFDGVSAAVTAWSPTSIDVTVPSALAAGAHAIWVTVGGQPTNGVPFTVTAAPPPLIAGVSPAGGGVAGTLVTLSGTRYGASQSASTLTLGGVLVTPTSWSNTSIQFLIPDAPAAGLQDLVVTVNGLASNAWPLTVVPSISKLTPPAGLAGATLVVEGANFGTKQPADNLYIGGLVAVVSTWNKTVIVAGLPGGLPPGPTDVYVVVGGQASNSASFYLAAATQPVITSLTPPAGMVGDPVAAAGANFGAVTAALTVGGLSAGTQSWSDAAIGFTVPALATGTHPVRVTTGAGGSNDFAFTVTTPTSPWITAVAPLAGSTGTPVVVTGARFGAAPGALTIGGVPATIATWSNTTIYASVPALPAGAHAVVVTSPGGENSNSVNFTLRPVINGLTPAVAIADQQVTLTGADFGGTQNASAVLVGGNAAAVDAWSNTSITFRVPTSLAAGAYGVAVRVNGQNSNSVGLTSLGALVIANVNPSSGSGGTSVVLTGANFGAAPGASTLTLGGAPVAIDAWTPTAVTFTVSDVAPAGLRAIALTVSGVAANAASFTVLPSLISVFPTGGPVGTDVTVTGTNFGASGALYLGGFAVPTQSWSNTSATFRVPAGYTAGDYAVTVVSGGQTSNALNFQVTAITSAAIIGGIAPTSAQAGATVTLTGVNFGAAQTFSTLHFDTGFASPVTWYDSAVTFNAPAVAPGTYDVWLTVNGTASNKVQFSVTTPTSPILSLVSPRAGPAGTAINLGGSSFGPSQGGSSVTVGGVAASVVGWADTLIGTSIPASLDAGIHNVVVTVGGEASNAVTFTVRPAITGLNPVSGVAGDPVVVTGTSFGAAQGISEVLIDGVAAAVSAWSNGSITFTVPTAVPAGALSVVVRVNGQVSNAQTFTVTSAGDPLISSLAPTVGSAGTQVVIAGTRFGSTQGASSVQFGGAAPTILSWSASAIRVEVPGTLAAGSQAVSVTVNGQVSNLAAFTVQPSLTALEPAGGSGGFAVAARGLNFGAAQGASRIYMAGVSAAVTAWANDRVDFVVPAGLTPGLQPVRVEVNGQFSNALDFAFAAPGAPALFGLTPAAGMVGATVVASGANFGTNLAAVSVDVGGSAATPANLTATSFEFTVPSLPPGTHAVVATVGGTSSNAVGFTVTTPTSPWITTVTPTSGPVGTNLVITGTQFGATGLLTIGGAVVAPLLWTDTVILAAVPSGVPAGLQGIVVAQGGENSNTVNFAVRPNVDTVAPASGVAGDNVTVTGTSFGAAQGAGGVTIGGVAAAVQSWSDTSLVVQVPAGAAAGNVYLVVTQGGQPSNSVPFSIPSAAAPSIAGLDVSFGVAGQTITISGSRFGATQGGSSLVLGGVVISPASWTNTAITFVVPGDIVAGAQSLAVTVAGQASNAAVFTILPSADAVSPLAGVAGSSVTLTGSNFGAAQGASIVTVGGAAATVTAWGMNGLTFTVPAVAPGAQPVVVTVAGQASNSASFFVTSGSGPAVTSIAPTSGPAGTTVTLTGANFGASGTLTFGGSVIASTVWNATQIQFVAPALPTGSYDVVVDTGELSNPVVFTITTLTSPWIDAVAPSNGVAGDLVTLTGQRFGAFAGASTVTVGGVAATLAGWSDTVVQIQVPAAAAAGLRPIVVTVNAAASNSFAFTVRPAITGLSPAAGNIGSTLTINGTGFGASGVATVGGVAAGVQSWSNLAVAVSVPTSLPGGTYDVVVAANGQFSNAAPYLITTGLPSIASLAPASGTAGTVVTVAGANFGDVQGVNGITVGGLAVTPTSWSDTSIVFTLPAQVPGGANAVVVTVAGNASNAAPFTAAPYVAAAAPAQVWSGDVVTLTGAGFGAAQGGSLLTLGGVSLTPATWSHTAITFVVPASVAPGVQTLALTVGGQLAQTTLDAWPDVTNVNPAAATAGQTVTLTGANFGGTAGSLSVGGVAVLPAWSATSISFTLPSDVAAGAQTILATAGGHVTDAAITVVPSILTVSPSPAVSGDTVSVTGSNFGATQGASTLTVLGVAVVPSSWSHTAITFSLPATIAAGAGNVVVTVGGQSATHAFAIDPTATGAFPSPATAGDTVTLSGASFGAAQGASTLTLGGASIAAASWSDTAITFAVPANRTAGSQAVAVSVNGRAASTLITIDPTVTAITAAGVAGDTFTISGTNFGPAAAGLTVGGAAVVPASWTATSITFVLPATIAGGAQTVVVTVNGRAASGAITVAPNITGVAPASGVFATAVNLTGTGFGAAQGGSALTLAGTALTPTSWSDTSIGFDVPAGVTAGTVQIAVTVGGQSDTQAFTVLPRMVSATPDPASYGDAIVVAGQNFGATQGASTLTLGGVTLAVSAWSDAQIDFALPATVPGGAHTLAATVGGNIASRGFTVVPRVASLTPAVGASGAAVTAAGGGFGAAQGGSTVTLGGVALSPTGWSATGIDFSVPSNVAAGQQNFVATVGGQASAPVTFMVDITVSGVAPATATEGTLVTVSGTNFGAAQGASTLVVGGVAVAASAWSHTAASFALPANVTAGVQAVALTVGGRTGAAALTIDPTITAVAPNFGGAGTTVTLTGGNFGASQGASTVTLGGTAVVVTAWSHTSVSFTVPNTVSAGAQTIAVTVGGRTVNAAFTVTNSLSGIAPASGSAGTAVTVSGSNFGAAQGGSAIALGGVVLVPTSWADTSIQFTVPNNVTAGVQAVVVTVGGQPTSGSFTVLPAISLVGSVAATGGDSVVLTGTNFGAVRGASTVTVGGVAAVTTAWSHTSITLIMPASVTAGTQNIAVTVGGQAVSASIAVDPSITSVAPATGGAGTPVTVTGTNFGAAQGASTLTLGGLALAPTGWTATSVSFTVPSSVTAGTQSLVVTVGGRSASTSFIVTHSIASVTPSSGTAGTAVTVAGAGFGAAQGASELRIGGVLVAATVWSQTSLEFTVPSNVTAGTQNVTVRIAGVDASAPFTVQPSISAITPAAGDAGTSVVLTGTNFGATPGASTLSLGGIAVAPSSWGHTSVSFTLANNVTAGTQAVVVTVGGQAANTTFTVNPSISNGAPGAGAGGASIAVSGANLGSFKGASTLRLANVDVSTTAWSMTGITFTVPDNVTAGTQSLVATVGGRVTDVTFNVDPFLASLSPAAGTGGTVVTVAATNLGDAQGSSVLTFGGVTLVPDAWSMTSLTFTVPATAPAGLSDVQVTVGGRASNTQTFTLAPYIASLAPATGSGGATVTLAGQNFGSIQGASTITVGGVAVTAVSWSNSSLTFDIPDTLIAGVHDVVVTVGGQASNARQLAVDPAITSLTPASGVFGTLVTVAGTNFGAAQGASTLSIGGVVTAPTSWSDTSLQFAVPATVAAGVQNVVVTVGGRASNAAAFTIAPTLVSSNPASGIAGASVVVTGANLGGAGTLTLGGVTLAPSAWSMTSLTFTVPGAVTAGTHSLQVTVGGQASNTLAFTILPSITSVSPQVGGGGTTVTVAGANFGGSADSLTLGGAGVTPDSWSNLSLTFTVTNAMLPGVHDLVATVGGQASAPATFTVQPALANLSPVSGNSGDSVTLSGTNFGPSAGSVKFGAATAVVTSWSNLTITVTVPALGTAVYDVSVIAGGVTSNTLAYAVTGIYGIASADTLDCEPVDGIIDHYKVTYSSPVSDATFDGYVLNGMGLSTARWSVAGRTNPRLHHGTSLPAACGVDVANDNVHYLMFDPGSSPDTGTKPDLTGTATLVQIAATGKRLYDDTGTWISTDLIETDKAAPYIYLAVAEEDDPVGGAVGIDAGDRIELRYSETTNAPALTTADLNALIELRDAANVLHGLGAVSDRSSAVWMASSTTNDTLRITFASANPTVAVGDKVRAQGTLITDLAANAPAPIAYVTTPPLVTGTFDPGDVGPKVVTASYYDLDADGYLDHLRLVFDKPLDDTTFPGYAGRNAVNAITSLWQVAGYNNVRLDTYDTVDGLGGANDAELWLVFDEGAAPDTGLTPDVTATAGSAGLRDTDGCYINADNAAPGCMDAAKARLASADVVEGDKAPPVIVRASGKIGGDRLYVSFSEAVYGAMNAPACGVGGEIAASDFVYGEVNAGGATGIASMNGDVCGIDDKQVALVTTGLITAGDINADYIRAASGTVVYDALNNAMRATDQRVIIDTTAPYMVAASSFRYGGKSWIRVVYSEPVQALTATLPANYGVVESPANAACADFSPTPLSVAQVSSTIYDLETGPQCGPATTPDTYYMVTANNILDVNENELIGSPNFATTLGTDPADVTQPRLLEAVAITPTTVRLTYSEPMRPGDVAGSAECASTFAAGRRCTDDVDAGAAGTQLKYTINPTLGNVSQVVATANPSVYLLTHQNAQSGGFYTITAYASNAVAAIPVDATGNLLLGRPDNQVTFQGRGAAIFDLEDGPLFSDPFVDGTSFSYAFKYANRVYLGPNDANSGAFRFEADGLNPTSVAFQGPALNADNTALTCPYASSFGVAGSISCLTNWGPNAETGLVGFNSGTSTIGGTPYEILMVGAIKDNVSHVYFTQDVDSTLNWISCPLSSFTGGGNTKSVQNTYTFADNMYAGISSNHNTQAPILIRTPLTATGGVLSCNVGSDLSVRQVAWIGKGGTPANPAVNASAVGIDTMIMVPGTVGSINPGVDTFYIANNGGVSKSDGTPASNASFTTVLTQTNFAGYAASTADNVTLVIDSLQKISPGRKGAPKFVIYKNTFFMARNVASAQTVAGQVTSAGGELWKCTTTCTNAANWSRVFTSSGAGSGAGIERATNTAVSLLEVSDGYLYVAFDNMADGARVYRTSALPGAMTPASFAEFGRVATAACTNHTGDTGALGGLCHAYQVLSNASIPKGAYSYLYLTVGCTLATESINGGKCDTDPTAAFLPPPVRVLVQRD